MGQLIFATNNEHKLFEIRNILAGCGYDILGLKEAGIFEEILEDHDTLEENAFQKARYISGKTGVDCFADDTGLEIEALGGEPGVYSARYSRVGHPVYPGMEVTAGNIKKVLEKMTGETNRKARFRTVIALIMGNREYTFEGIVEGEILKETRGLGGFGYDPIFLPESSDHTFAQMKVEEKNRVSHRARAVNKLVDFLRERDQS